MAPKMMGSKDEFVEWLKVLAADTDRKTKEYCQLYHHLLHCFVEGDNDLDGAIDQEEFVGVVKKATHAPLKHGLQPQQGKSEEEQTKFCKDLFKKIDSNNDGKLSFDEFLKYSYTDIVGMAKGL